MKQSLRSYLAALALALLCAAGCQGQSTRAPMPTTPPEPASQPQVAEGGGVTALGTIIPAQHLKLGFLVGGPVLVHNVQVGSQVEARELLAALDQTDFKIAVQEAEDALAVSQALLVQAKAGPQEQAIAVATAQYQQAQEQYEQAQARYERAVKQIHPEKVAIAQTEYNAALARYQQVKAGAGPEALAGAQAQMQKAGIYLKRAQAAYDRVAGQPDVGASPAAAALQEATINYQAAQSEYERLQNLPTEAARMEAQAYLDQARAQLRLAQVGPPGEEKPSASGVAVAKTQLELVRAGLRPEDLAVVEARVQQARAAQGRAVLAMARSELRAPFGGTISAVYVHAGEWAAPGAPVVGLLDTTRWRVETRNIGEQNIGRVRVGQEAVVRLMAFRPEELRGRVVAVSPVAVVQQGDTTYTILIELEPTDLNLRPGMNAEVQIVTE